MTTLSDLRKLQTEASEHIATHKRRKTAVDYSRYADDPAGFMRDVLQCSPWAKQIEIAERLRDKPADKTGTLIVTSNGLGKDWAVARVALWWVYARGGFVILSGPTDRQTRNILMKEVRRAWNAVGDLPGTLFAMALEATDDSGILAFTSDDGNKLVGFHHPRLLVCMTEGQGVEPDAYDAAFKCCTGAENRLLVYGNPTEPTGPFYDAATRGNWDVLTVNALEHPNIISGREEIPGSITREQIAAYAREYGESSPFYLSAVLAQFPDTAINGLIERSWLHAANARHTPDAIDAARLRYPLLLSLDVARLGQDSCALGYIYGPVVEKLETWKQMKTMETVQHVHERARAAWAGVFSPKILRHYPHLGVPPTILIDSNGIGAGVADRLAEIDPYNGKVITSRGARYRIIEYNGATKAFDEKRFINLRANSHWSFREGLDEGKIVLPHDKLLEEEAMAVRWTLAQPGNRIQALAKDTMRETLKRSPDRLDAVVMGLGYSMGGLRHTVTATTFQLAG